MIQERRPPIKGLHQVTSQLQQKCPHRKKNSSTPKVTPLLKLQKLPRCQDPKMMMMMKVFWTLLHHQKHFPQKVQSPPQNPITDHNFKKKKNFLVYHNIVTCFQLKKCIYSDAYIVACPDMCQPCKYVLQFLFYFTLAKVVKHKNTCTTM